MKYKISFCIACMNRLHQLQQTLPANLEDAAYDENLEFVVLDYNSADGLEAWIMEHMMEHIESGRLVYYKTTEPAYFNHSHAKNAVLKSGTGDIVCNINADHYTGKGFATHINAVFTDNPHTVLTPIPLQFYKRSAGGPPGDVWGKVCVKKEDFLRVRGFDERMIKFGNDDIDFVNRLEMDNIKRTLLTDPAWWKFISHTQEERFSSRNFLNNISALYIHYRSPSASDLIFLYRGGEFEKGTLTDNSIVDAGNYTYSYEKREFMYPWSLTGIQNRGMWKENINEHYISFHFTEGNDFVLIPKYKNRYDTLINEQEGSEYREITDPAVIDKVSVLNYNYFNIELMKQNLYHKQVQVNPLGFGEVRVTKNFL